MSMTLAARASASPTLSAPVRSGKGRKRRPATFGTRFWRAVGQRPGRSLILLAFSAVAAAILVNALFYQEVPKPKPPRAAPLSVTGGAVTPSQPARAERRAEPAQTPAVHTPAAPASAPAQPTRIEDLLAPGGAASLPPPRPSQRQLQPQPQTPRPSAATSAPRQAQAQPAPAPAATRPVAVAAPRDPIADLINDLRPPGEIRARPTTR